MAKLLRLSTCAVVTATATEIGAFQGANVHDLANFCDVSRITAHFQVDQFGNHGLGGFVRFDGILVNFLEYLHDLR